MKSQGEHPLEYLALNVVVREGGEGSINKECFGAATPLRLHFPSSTTPT